MALYLDGQKIISGGSGSGGHTIVDSEGTSLEQRTNLQFNGAYSEDNSTDDTTEVNVVREMTKAEFDELTEEEKTGFINITDITSGNDDRFQPVIYSSEEREIGVWKDGKPIYQKTYNATFTNIASDTPQTVADISSIGIDTLVTLDGSCAYTTEGFTFSSNLGGYFVCYAYPTGNLTFSQTMTQQTTGRTYVVEVTLYYTKTTDTSGSGQWTPQGVPAHHYSEDEQVVGTWIDGSTVYERTISFTTPNDSNYTRQPVGLLTAEIDKIWVVDSFTYKGSIYTSAMPYAYTNNTVADEQFEGFINKSSTNVAFDYRVGNSLYEASAYITIRYTKSST